MKHVEMIIDYITDGTDYQYNDNHGLLIRCRDCRYNFASAEPWEGIPSLLTCSLLKGICVGENDYCSFGEEKDD